MRQLKNVSVAIGLLLGLMLTAEARAQTVHFFVVGDTRDGSIGKGVARNFLLMGRLANAFEHESRLKVVRHELSGQQFSCNALEQLTNAIARDGSIKPDDVIFFYYAGHGYRDTSTSTKFPKLKCDGAGNLRAIDMANIVTRLKRAGARLIITVADACNEQVGEGTPGCALCAVLEGPHGNPPGLRHLLLDYRGTLTVSGAAPRGVAYYAKGESGGLFTWQFVTTLEDGLAKDMYTSPTKVSWEKLIPEAIRPIPIFEDDPSPASSVPTTRQHGDPNYNQIPQADIQLTSRPPTTGSDDFLLAQTPVPKPPDIGPAPSGPVVTASVNLRPGNKFRDCPGCPEMVVVPAGTFVMGSPANESGRRGNEGPEHTVQIATAFAIGVDVVAAEEWDACVADRGCDERPDFFSKNTPMFVDWNTASKYVGWLNMKTGGGYRLASEAEWEYAARAGSRAAYWFGSDSDLPRAVERVGESYKASHHTVVYKSNEPAQQKAVVKPNGFGLRNTLGSGFEWTSDCWHENYVGAPGDGTSWQAGGDCWRRVIRGGDWPKVSRSAQRDRLNTWDTLTWPEHASFRVVRSF